MNFDQLLVSIRKYRYEAIAVIFTLYGMYLRYMSLAKRQLWTDELSLLGFMQESFKPLWQRHHYADFTYFPGEYIINWPFVFFFKTNRLGIAIPHIFITLLGFYFLYFICKRYFCSVFAWITTFTLVAVHRELVFHSFELRPYAVLPTLALGVFYFSEQIISSCYHLSLLKKVFIGFFFIFTIIFHAYGAIIVSLIFIYYLLNEYKGGNFREIIKHNYCFVGIMILIGLPLFLWYSLDCTDSFNMEYYDVFKYINNPLVDFFGFIKTILCCLIGEKFLYFLIIFSIFPFFLHYDEKLQQIGFLLILVILPISILLYADLLNSYWFLQRQFIWVMPLFAFFIGWCLDSFIKFCSKR